MPPSEDLNSLPWYSATDQIAARVRFLFHSPDLPPTLRKFLISEYLSRVEIALASQISLDELAEVMEHHTLPIEEALRQNQPIPPLFEIILIALSTPLPPTPH